MEKAIFCWSGGKDSALALYRARRSRRYDVVALLTTLTRDYDRISMHGVRRALLEAQARAIGLPLIPVLISKADSDAEYEASMAATLGPLKSQGVSAVLFGDIFLEDLRRYREEKLMAVGMKAAFPLWQENTTGLAASFIEQGFRAVTTCVDSRVLGEGFVGRNFDRGFLSELPAAADPCGENGEFHSFVWGGPLFSHAIKYTPGERVLRNGFYFCDLLPQPAHGH